MHYRRNSAEAKIIGQRIKEYREEKSISMDELCTLTGISKTTLYRYETGQSRMISLSVLRKIAKCLNVDECFYIIDGENTERGLKSPNMTLRRYLHTIRRRKRCLRCRRRK